MKYKIGDEVLIRAKIIKVSEEPFPSLPYMALIESKKQCKGAESKTRAVAVVDEDVIVDMTAEEAWKIAKNIVCPAAFGGFSADDANDIFGTASTYDIMQRFTPQQAKTKIKAWEAGEEIGIGDVVKAKNSAKAVVLDIHDKYFDVLVENGCTEEWYKSKITKTGRHIDIQGVLEQIRGAE